MTAEDVHQAMELKYAEIHMQSGMDSNVCAYLGTGHWPMVGVYPAPKIHIGMAHAVSPPTVSLFL